MRRNNERVRAMARKYVALIRKDPGTDYRVNVPDIPGCVASGETEEKAKANYQEIVVLHLEALSEQGTVLSAPRSRDDVLAAEEDEYLSDYIVEI